MTENSENFEAKLESNKKRIADLEEELRECRANEESLEAKIKSLEKEIQDLKDENTNLAKQLQEVRSKVEKLEKENEDQKAQKDLEDSVLIIIQVGPQTQRNLCKYVLRKYFKNTRYYKFKEIDSYIREIAEPAENESAKERLEELKSKISWDQHLVDSLKNLNQKRIGIAHPELSSEKIQRATEFLREKNELDEEMVENIEKLKEQWEASETLLQKSSAGCPRNVPTRGRKLGTYANEVTNGHLYKRARKCQ